MQSNTNFGHTVDAAFNLAIVRIVEEEERVEEILKTIIERQNKKIQTIFKVKSEERTFQNLITS